MPAFKGNNLTGRIIVAVVAIALVGCAGSPVALASKSVDELRSVDPLSLCNAYAVQRNTYGSTQTIRQAIEERGIVKPQNWSAVDAGTVRLEFTEAELVCARGMPEKINSSASIGSGERKQWVYRGYKSANYFYTQGGIVTGWN